MVHAGNLGLVKLERVQVTRHKLQGNLSRKPQSPKQTGREADRQGGRGGGEQG